MQFEFDPNQDYQVEAVQSVAQLLDGQPRVDATPSFEFGVAPGTVGNRLDLSVDDLLANLNAVQAQNGLATDTELQTITGEFEADDGTTEVMFPNFSVEMETGTGKTYVYIRTALEL